MNMHNNKGCGCGCSGNESVVHSVKFKANGATQRQPYNGKDHLVVPLVMLRETVVNGGLVTLSELKPMGWNGVPVTIGHPTGARGANVSASQNPKISEAVKVGTIFGAELVGDKLKAQAWIDVEAAEQRHPGIIATLESELPMDVSVGYFSTDEQRLGTFNNKPYFEVHKDLKPDHLALLPDEEGACSWADGCGVRVNRKEDSVNERTQQPSTTEELVGVRKFLQAILPHTQRRGNDDDMRQMVADLISNDATPFVPDDEFALREMSQDSLKDLRDKYVPKANNATQEGGQKMADNKKPEGSPEVKAMTADDVKAIFTQVLSDTLPGMIKTHVDEAVNADKREAYIEAVHTNMGLPKEELAKLGTDALKTMSEKLVKKADFTGRGLKTQSDDSVQGDGNTRKYAAMAQPHVHHLQPKKEA